MRSGNCSSTLVKRFRVREVFIIISNTFSICWTLLTQLIGSNQYLLICGSLKVMNSSLDVESLSNNVRLKWTLKIIEDRIYKKKLVTTNLKKSALRRLTIDTSRELCFPAITGYKNKLMVLASSGKLTLLCVYLKNY